VTPPRFLLVRGVSGTGDRRPPWPGAGRPCFDRSSRPAWVTWRLVAANNRELARSSAVFSGSDECSSDVGSLRDALAACMFVVEIERTGRAWNWSIAVDGECRVVGSRLYARRLECRHSCQLFLAAAPLAVWGC